MRHEAGMSWLDHSFRLEELTRESVKSNNAVGRVIERAPLRYPKCGVRAREYHAITQGTRT